MKRATTPSSLPPIDPLEYELWLDGIVSLEEGAGLRSVSLDTLRREHDRGRVKFVQVSERRKGIRRRDALLK
jgi:hypothetical protein